MTRHIVSFFAILIVTSIAFAADKPMEGDIKPFLGEPQLDSQQVFKNERFPNIVVSTKGTLIATWGSKNIRARRSEDGGKTWGKEIAIGKGIHGGGTTVDETTGYVFAFVEDKHPPAPLKVYLSTDDGKTWQAHEVKIQPDSKGKMPSMHMNEHGITLRHGKHRGRLVRPSRNYGKGNRPASLFPTHYTNAIYSDDGGKTWKTSEPFPANGTGEATVVELSSGELYYNTRRHWAEKGANPRRRWDVRSDDGGATWKDFRMVQALPDGPQDRDYGCMGGLVRLPIKGRDILLYTNCDSPGGRKLGTVWASFDGGRTWPIKRLVFKGSHAYSSITAGRPGTVTEGLIFHHFEGGPKGGSTVATFNLAWVLGGQATGDGSIPSDLAK